MRVVGKAVRRRAVWMAMAVSVTSRLWLGGVVRETRGRQLIHALLMQVRACGAITALLLCTDGFTSYPTQATRVFRQAGQTGIRDRPRLVLPDGLLIAQVVKRYAKRHVTAVAQRVAHGCRGAVVATLLATQGTTTITTAYIERLNATFRARLAPLARRGRAGVHHWRDAGSRTVGCRSGLQLPHAAPQSRRSNPGTSGEVDRPLLDDARTAHLSRAAPERATPGATT